MQERLIDFLREPSVLILGFGREGRATYDMIRRSLPDKHIGIADVRELQVPDPNVTLHCGKDYLDAVRDYRIVIKTPGVSLKDVSVPEGVFVTCQTDLFLHFCACPCVGVTGTKGKTIVSTLIYDMLRAGGKHPCLIGSIGIPVFEAIDTDAFDVAVIEMSCHQLEFTSASPHVAVLTNLYSEHLDHYNGFAGYAASKMNILRHQGGGDYFLCNAEQPLERYYAFYQAAPTVRRIGVLGSSADAAVVAAAKLNSHLPGRHSLQNVCLAAEAARCLEISETAILSAVESFAGVPHRLEPIGIHGGIRFYNDVLATIPEATQCAVEAISDADTLIFGGTERQRGYADFEAYLAECRVRNLIGLPDSGTEICKRLQESSCAKTIVFADDMEAAVEAAFRLTTPGKSCILSPGASSYNVYRDYEHKGAHFKALVAQHDAD
ncbi:MAG: UDP-N-acetylmuramoyl-L-alanine--D-glutamate ligase [Clostridia bacterium]|nr:UDP-N-acetylmuramoyl-L-alanine--D-glutamate ligase [Clostridia bacterium]